jgi:O-antigen ligase
MTSFFKNKNILMISSFWFVLFIISILKDNIVLFFYLNFALIGIGILSIKPKYYLIVILFINESFFHLISMTNLGSKLYLDILILLIPFMVITLKKCINVSVRYHYKKIIIIILVLLPISVITSNANHGQPYFLGLLAARFLLLYLYYFPFRLYVTKYGTHIVKKQVIWVATFLSIGYIIQKAVYPNIIIFQVTYGERFGDVRFIEGYVLIVIASFLALSKVFETKENSKYIYLSAFILFQVYFLYVSQIRSSFFICLILYIIILCIQYKRNPLLYTGLGVFGILVLFILIGDKVLNLIFYALNDIKFSSSEGNLYIRLEAIGFVLEEIKLSPIFGLGLYNGKLENYQEIVGISQRFYLSDIGIFGFLFQFGVVGVILTVFILVYLFKIILKFLKTHKEKSYFYIMFINYFILIVIFNYIFNMETSVIYFVLTLALLEQDSLSQKNKKMKSDI